MPQSSTSFTPFIPDENALVSADLPDKVMQLMSSSAKLAGLIPAETAQTITVHMSVINSYYSNLIEGNRTQPHEIRAAQNGDLSLDPAKRDMQLESIAHIKVQQWIEGQNLSLNEIYTPNFIQAIHREFYKNVPTSLHALKNKSGEIIDEVAPGCWRKKSVIVGRHEPPAAEDVEALIESYCDIYNPTKYSGDKKIIAIMCAHHRFAWIHPFSDGNGRVVRLFTDAALKAVGIESYGVWCLSRGLAKSSDQYKALLSAADVSRQGDLDGRGQLSQRMLVQFCEYLLKTAQDQVDYTSGLLLLDKMRERIQSYIHARNDGRVMGKGKIKENAALVLYNAFVNGRLERSLAIELCGMQGRSARRLLAQLKEEGLLRETSTRSPLYWKIPDHAEPWYFPQLTPGAI